MSLFHDPQFLWLVLLVLGILTTASVGAWLGPRGCQDEAKRVVFQNLTSRLSAWWIMVAFFFLAVAWGRVGAVLLFASLSFLAFREFITLTPTQRGDHRSLFWAFFIILPMQYILVGLRRYELFSIFIPVYAFLLIPVRSVLAGDGQEFLARTAKIQWGLMVCVYFLSYAPALLTLEFPGHERSGAKLLFFFVFVVQISDVLQDLFGKYFGRHPVAPQINPHKTVEGGLGGIVSATMVGGSLWWITPFTFWPAVGISFLIAGMGFFGGLVMSAIKRDRGVKDEGRAWPGHGRIMDRIDSLCFAAPVFFQIVHLYVTR
jgi:phosphatidate cytidylyltransferase